MIWNIEVYERGGGEGEKDKVEAGWNIKVKGYKLVCVI